MSPLGQSHSAWPVALPGVVFIWGRQQTSTGKIPQVDDIDDSHIYSVSVFGERVTETETAGSAGAGLRARLTRNRPFSSGGFMILLHQLIL